MNWTTDYPHEPGPYWFYGMRFRKDREPELCFCTAHRPANGGITVVAQGNLLFRGEAFGYFAKADLPDTSNLDLSVL